MSTHLGQQIEIDTHCPANKAAELIGDSWTLQILRSMMLGATRFSDLQHSIPRISPAVLSGRLKTMADKGLIVRRENGGRSATYRLTASGRDLRPIIRLLSSWGMRWAARNVKDPNFDIGALMWDLHRSLRVRELPDGQNVIAITIPDLERYSKWWIVAKGRRVGLWDDDPGIDVHIYLTCKLPDLVALWQGRQTVREAIAANKLIMVGEPDLTRTIDNWFPVSPALRLTRVEDAATPA